MQPDNIKPLEEVSVTNKWSLAAFNYDPAIKSQDIPSISITCSHCQAKKWKTEAPAICCSNGKVKLQPLKTPPSTQAGGKKYIVLQKRGGGELKRITGTNRAYDDLQYRLMFWQGEDGCNVLQLQVDSTTGEPNIPGRRYHQWISTLTVLCSVPTVSTTC